MWVKGERSEHGESKCGETPIRNMELHLSLQQLEVACWGQLQPVERRITLKETQLIATASHLLQVGVNSIQIVHIVFHISDFVWCLRSGSRFLQATGTWHNSKVCLDFSSEVTFCILHSGKLFSQQVELSLCRSCLFYLPVIHVFIAACSCMLSCQSSGSSPVRQSLQVQNTNNLNKKRTEEHFLIAICKTVESGVKCCESFHRFSTSRPLDLYGVLSVLSY